MAETNPGASKMEHRLVVLHFFSQRTSSRRKRLIQEWVRSTIHRCARYPGIDAFSYRANASERCIPTRPLVPECRIVVSLIRAQMLRVLFVRFRSWCNCLRQRVLSSFISWRFAPSTTTPKGCRVHPSTDSVSRHACRDPSD